MWVYDRARETFTRLTFARTSAGNPAWTPDSKRVVFQSGTPLNLFWQPADGSGNAEPLATSEYRQGPSSWSPDGQLLAWVFRLSDRKAEPFLRNARQRGRSPDGHWLA